MKRFGILFIAWIKKKLRIVSPTLLYQYGCMYEYDFMKNQQKWIDYSGKIIADTSKEVKR